MLGSVVLLDGAVLGDSELLGPGAVGLGLGSDDMLGLGSGDMLGLGSDDMLGLGLGSDDMLGLGEGLLLAQREFRGNSLHKRSIAAGVSWISAGLLLS